MTDIKIDIYNHVLPLPYLELVKKHGKEPGMIKRMTNLRMLWDMPARVAMLDTWPEVQQVLSLSLPSPEMLGGPEDSPAFARVANEAMADICKQWPHKFPTFVASLPMNNPEAALAEMDYAIEKLGAKGFDPAVGWLTKFGPGRSDGGDGYRVLKYNPGCSRPINGCFEYASAVKPFL